MKIHSLSVEAAGEGQRIAARIGASTLWFRVPRQARIEPSDASPFLVAALIPAMVLGEDIEVDSALYVSTRLLAAVERLQSIYTVWNPVFRPVSVAARQARLSTRGERNASFFSGGVDGTYTLLTHQAAIDDLVLINGFDFTMDAPTWAAMVARNRRFAESVGKALVPVETNFKSFTAGFSLARKTNFGSVLAAIALLLGYRTVYLSGSETYRVLRAEGSHPLTDPLWSTEATAIVHTGLEADRVAKLERIAKESLALRNLWVCWEDPRVNCGRCSKCLRTAMALEILGLPVDLFERKPTTADYRRIRLRGEEDAGFYGLFLTAARQRGREDLVRILRRLLLAYASRSALLDVLDLALPDALLQRLRPRPAGDELVDIGLHPRYSDEGVLARVRDRLARGETGPEVAVGSIFADLGDGG